MAKIQSELEKAKEIINDTSDFDDNLNENPDFESFIINVISSNIASTIGIKYESGNIYVTSVYPNTTKLSVFKNYLQENYETACKNLFNVDLSEKYNCSRTCNIKGVKTRVYAVMPPFTKTPNITISTTKIPPSTLNKQTIPDEVWNDIVHSNFIIVGQSGSGKTYLINYLLNKFIRPDERIAIIEEFGELIPPNALTTSIIVPPPKPDEPSLLKFVTEQSNLMRLDAVYVGEIKSAEAWPFVVNLASGTRGGASLHGETATQALNRLRALCQLSCDNNDAIDEFIAKSIKYVVVMKNKNIQGIYKLMGTHNKNSFAMQEIYS